MEHSTGLKDKLIHASEGTKEFLFNYLGGFGLGISSPYVIPTVVRSYRGSNEKRIYKKHLAFDVEDYKLLEGPNIMLREGSAVLGMLTTVSTLCMCLTDSTLGDATNIFLTTNAMSFAYEGVRKIFGK